MVRQRRIKAEFEASIREEAKQKLRENPNYNKALKDKNKRITTDFNGKLIKIRKFVPAE